MGEILGIGVTHFPGLMLPDAYHLADVRAKIADLRSMEHVLADAVRRCATGATLGCPIIDTLSGRCFESL